MRIPRRDMAFEYLSKQQILFSYTGPEATPEQWDGYIALMRSLAQEANLRFMVFVEGPPPSLAHQKRVAENVQRQWPVAIVSSSTAMRFVVSTFALVNRSVRYFSPEQFADACAHIGCSEKDVAVSEALMRMQFEN